jgi:hypothetical protein
MQAVCKDCGEPMMAGQVVSQKRSPLSFVVSSGTPTSWNPVTAVLQGMQEVPDYREESFSIRGRVCPRCGKVEFHLGAADLIRVGALATPTTSE